VTDATPLAFARSYDLPVTLRIDAMRRSLVAFALSLAPLAGHANDWIVLGETDRMVWEGRAGTRDFDKNRGGEPIITAAGRTREKVSNRISFVRWYARVDDCRLQYGKLVTTDMGGTFLREADFVLGGGTIASSLAEVLCHAVSETDRKGI
jgi:hypothetical protein